ncbi:MAG: RibD family protein [Planctomycetes bacterium]|nr:RibD family protein [Planctomycetota bacterium]
MTREIHDAAWPAMLEARRLLASGATLLTFVDRDGQWQCLDPERDLPAGSAQVLMVGHESHDIAADVACTLYGPRDDGPAGLSHPHGRPIDVAMQVFARIYLPVLLGTAAAARAGRVFVAAHVTQTLDGRIACANGQSQWIGNAEDLRHAHCMRALLGGVLVGANTVLQDDPRLTVRHVTGDDPRRVVLSGDGSALRTGEPRNVYDPPGSLAIVRADAVIERPSDHVDIVAVEANGEPGLHPASVLEALREQGIDSIYLEGGASTVSSFLQAGAIDLLQVHIAPMVLGSGLSSFALPIVEHVDFGLPFTVDHTLLGDHLFLTCWPRRRSGAR